MSKLLLFITLPVAGAFTHNLLHASSRWQQATSGALEAREPQGSLAFMHVPFNFGHTVESVAAFSGVIWGSMNPALTETSNATGCPYYFTPPKYWPVDLANQYFGSSEVFGILRDPYERLVAMFRGGMEGYGAAYNHSLLETCDIDQGIQEMLHNYLYGGNRFASDCALIPQAEYFEGPYAITVPVDNRLFPHSANAVLAEHGYPIYIPQDAILHVSDCQEKWSADLSPETRRLIRQIYAKDFELLCSHFGYCDNDEVVCLTYVNGMCPESVFSWNPELQMYQKS